MYLHVCTYIQKLVMKTCLYKYAAEGDIAHSPGNLLSQ